MELLDRFVAQLGALQSLWMPFLLALVVVGLGIWRIMAWRYAATIETLEHRVRLRDDQIASLDRRREGHQSPSPPRPATFVATTHLASASPSRRKTDPAERVHLQDSLTPRALMELYREQRTTLAAHRAVQDMIGKWLKVEGEVDDISGRDSRFTIYLKTESISLNSSWYATALVAAYFRDATERRLETLQPGVRIAFEGQIDEITRSTVSFDNCDLLGVG